MTAPVASIPNLPNITQKARGDAKSVASFEAVLDAKLQQHENQSERTPRSIANSSSSVVHTRSAEEGKPAERGEEQPSARKHNDSATVPTSCAAPIVVSQSMVSATSGTSEAPEPQSATSLASAIAPAFQSTNLKGSNIVVFTVSETGNVAIRPSEPSADSLGSPSLGACLNVPPDEAGKLSGTVSAEAETIVGPKLPPVEIETPVEVPQEADETPTRADSGSRLIDGAAPSIASLAIEVDTAEPAVDRTSPAETARTACPAPNKEGVTSSMEFTNKAAPQNNKEAPEKLPPPVDAPVSAASSGNLGGEHRVREHEKTEPWVGPVSTSLQPSAQSTAESASSPPSSTASATTGLQVERTEVSPRSGDKAGKDSEQRSSSSDRHAGESLGITAATRESGLNTIRIEGSPATEIHHAPDQAPLQVPVPGRPQPAARANDPAAPVLTPSVHMARVMDKAGQAEMHIGLQTSSFGNVEVHTVVRDTHVGLAFASEKGDLRSLIAPEMPSLESSFRQHDLRLESLQFFDPGYGSGQRSGSGEDSRSFRHFQRFSQSHTEETVPEASTDVMTILQSRKGLNLHA